MVRIIEIRFVLFGCLAKTVEMVQVEESSWNNKR